MSQLKYLCLPLLWLLLVGCKDGDTPEVTPTGPIEEAETFTPADATTAFEAFNQYFYNPDAKLYYSTTDHNGLAAIWTQAIFWDMVMDAYQRTNNPDYLKQIGDIYEGGYKEYDGYNWNNTQKWFIYDDMMWWVIAMARAYEITRDAKYLETSVAGFQHVWRASYDARDGGMFWNFAHDGKNSCINYPTVIAALKLYSITGEAGYLDKGKEIYTWSRANLFNNGQVADNINMARGNVSWTDYTYNQGTCIGAAVLLYQATGEDKYLQDAKLAADYTKYKMADADGILPAEGDWNEQGVLKAIFGRYMMMLIQDGKQPQYLPWLRQNIDKAWQNRDKTRNLTYRNYKIACPTGNIQSYEASSAVELMQVCTPKK
ncbi:glycoside hydrolase family 76 protein [Pontibacter sp. HJ8]